jgi:arylsulfatase A-like enzyme
MVEVFDPHEPFDCSDEYLALYEDAYDGPRYEWSGYAPVGEPAEATEHLRRRYAATLTMADRWLGKFLDKLEELDVFEETLLVLTTDHGHMLGEHGFTGKNYMHVYNELAHLPLLVHLPAGARAGERVDALTQNIDLMPTILDYRGIDAPQRLHGGSLRPLLENRTETHRDVALYGWFGKAVNITDGRYTYFRAPVRDDNFPCFAYCGIPTTLWRYMGVEAQRSIETGPFLKHTDYPVYRIPINSAREMGGLKHVRESLLFDIAVDYRQERPVRDERLEKQMAGMLAKAMTAVDAPDDQFERLGLD